MGLRTEDNELADILESDTPLLWLRTEFDRSKLTWPVFEYRHGPEGCAVIGGAVYRGAKFPDWHGTYLFSDFCTGQNSALRRVKGKWQYRLIAKTTAEQPTVLGTGSDGEILVAHYDDGGIYRLSFPGNFDKGWVPAELLMLKRRVEQLEMLNDALRNSRSWRWTKPLRAISRRIRDLFPTDK